MAKPLALMYQAKMKKSPLTPPSPHWGEGGVRGQSLELFGRPG